MATNRYLRLFLAFLICTGISPSLTAQSAGYFIETEGGEAHFIQRLVWTGGEYALRYEVVIEREVNGRNTAHLRESTEMSFIEVSLPPGNYRFQVISYDILGRPDEVSEWKYIEVRPAIQPEISDVLLALVSGDSYETSGYVLNIFGDNFTPDSEFIILNSDGSQILPEVLVSGTDWASLFVESGKFTPGEYDLVVINPGGLEAGKGGIVNIFAFPEKEEEKEEEKPVEEKTEQPKPPRTSLYLANVAWAPVFPFHGTSFGTNASLLAAGVRLGVVYPLPLDFYFGAEVTAFNFEFERLEQGLPYYDVENVLSVGANLVAMKWLPNQTMALSFRLGLSYFLDGIATPEIDANGYYDTYISYFALNIGGSYLWRFAGIFTLEAGLDYSVLLGSFDGSLRPWIGLGIIF